MTGIRRALILAGLTLAVMIGGGIPASATFSESLSVAPRVSTLTVAPPTGIAVNDYCWTRTTWTTNPTTGVVTPTYTPMYTATISWTASATQRGVTGYRVMAHLNNGASYVMATTGAATTSIGPTAVEAYMLSMQPRISILTLTSYGWTAESPRTAVLAC